MNDFMKAPQFVVRTRDVDGPHRDSRRYKTLKAAVKRFEEMLGYTVEQAIDEVFFDRDPKPSIHQLTHLRYVSMYGTVVLLEKPVTRGGPVMIPRGKGTNGYRPYHNPGGAARLAGATSSLDAAIARGKERAASKAFIEVLNQEMVERKLKEESSDD